VRVAASVLGREVCGCVIFAYLLFQLAHSIYPNGVGGDIKVLVQFSRTDGRSAAIDIPYLIFLLELSMDGVMSWVWHLKDVLCLLCKWGGIES
jgi:hypothetical protein